MGEWAETQPVLTMYMGDPQSVAAIMLFCRCRAKPKSAGEKKKNNHQEDGQQGAHCRHTV